MTLEEAAHLLRDTEAAHRQAIAAWREADEKAKAARARLHEAAQDVETAKWAMLEVAAGRQTCCCAASHEGPCESSRAIMPAGPPAVTTWTIPCPPLPPPDTRSDDANEAHAEALEFADSIPHCENHLARVKQPDSKADPEPR